MKKLNLTPLEHDEQVTVVAYLELLLSQGRILGFTAVPQNMWTKSWKQKRKATQEGVRPGFPDLVIVTLNKVLFLEMKRIKGGVLSDEQIEWNLILKDKETRSDVCYGASEAIKYLDKEL